MRWQDMRMMRTMECPITPDYCITRYDTPFIRHSKYCFSFPSFQRLVRDVVDNFTGISTENDALTVPSVDVRSAQQYALGNVAGPTLVEGQTPLFLEGTVKSEWNADVITLLAVHARMEAYRTSVSGKDEGMPFFTTLVSNRIGRLCTIRHKYAEKSVNGALETAQERGVRIAAGQAAQREKSRTDGRRYKVSRTRPVCRRGTQTTLDRNTRLGFCTRPRWFRSARNAEALESRPGRSCKAWWRSSALRA